MGLEYVYIYICIYIYIYINTYLAMLHNVGNHIDQARSVDELGEAAAALSEGVDLAQG